ncbi:hypothetical protein DRE_04420 [Drechslerella stenobrocha 248]|uniref:Uncharacterized protein n=1 Tax=Drechslerella stenobrocha 248 TaxID=1043628 RepID=W7HSL7_9PEZI|nr:hypothetical protein DRE_04420 [Drechslerella stenobrocha 248]
MGSGWCCDACTSSRTAYAWQPVGSHKAILLALSFHITSIIALVVTVVINVTSANAPDNDYGPGTGWIIMMPGVGVAVLWSSICILLCRFSYLSPVLVIASHAIIAPGLVAEGILTILFYEWHTIAWLPAVFMFLVAISSSVFAGYAVRAHRKRKVPQNKILETA